MKKYLIFALSLALLLTLSGPILAAELSLPNPLCPRNNNGDPINAATCIDSFPRLIEQVTTYISTIVGILAVLMFVIAGIFFIISAGNPDKTQKAKDIAKWAAIGVGISLAGNGLVAIVRAVIGNTPN